MPTNPIQTIQSALRLTDEQDIEGWVATEIKIGIEEGNVQQKGFQLIREK